MYATPNSVAGNCLSEISDTTPRERVEASPDIARESGDTISENGSHLNAGPVLPVRHGRPLTQRQASILEFINAHCTTHGCAPTLREIARAFNIRSTNGVNDHLRALERKGYIARRDVLARGIRVVNPYTGEAIHFEPPDPVGFLSAENEALRSVLRRVLAAGGRLTFPTAEMVIVLGDVRDALVAGGGT